MTWPWSRYPTDVYIYYFRPRDVRVVFDCTPTRYIVPMVTVPHTTTGTSYLVVEQHHVHPSWLRFANHIRVLFIIASRRVRRILHVIAFALYNDRMFRS